jgi:hypothetical protein
VPSNSTFKFNSTLGTNGKQSFNLKTALASLIQANAADAAATLKWDCIARIAITNTTNLNDNTQSLNLSFKAINDPQAPDSAYKRTKKGVPINSWPYLGSSWFVQNWTNSHNYVTFYDSNAFNPFNETTLEWKYGFTFMMLDEPYQISQLIMQNDDSSNAAFTVTVTMGTVLRDTKWWNTWEAAKLGQTTSGIAGMDTYLGRYVYDYWDGITFMYENQMPPGTLAAYGFSRNPVCPFVVY